MNALLAKLFAFLNAVVRFLIVVFGCFVAYAIFTDSSINGLSLEQAAPLAIATLIAAIFIAVMLCGLIALLAEIERHLRELKEDNRRYSNKLRPQESKQEPSV